MQTLSTRDHNRTTLSIRYAVAGTLFAAALQILVGVLLYLHRADFEYAQAQLNPGLSGIVVRDRADAVVVGGLITHVLLFVAYIALAIGVSNARTRARVRLTVLLVVSTIVGTIAAVRLGADVPSIQSGMIGVQMLSTGLRLAVIWLLWMPQMSREFFARDVRN